MKDSNTSITLKGPALHISSVNGTEAVGKGKIKYLRENSK